MPGGAGEAAGAGNDESRLLEGASKALEIQGPAIAIHTRPHSTAVEDNLANKWRGVPGMKNREPAIRQPCLVYESKTNLKDG